MTKFEIINFLPKSITTTFTTIEFGVDTKSFNISKDGNYFTFVPLNATKICISLTSRQLLNGSEKISFSSGDLMFTMTIATLFESNSFKDVIEKMVSNHLSIDFKLKNSQSPVDVSSLDYLTALANNPNSSQEDLIDLIPNNESAIILDSLFDELLQFNTDNYINYALDHNKMHLLQDL